jgi:RimJ/RimL family protein N-acetyltransferase
MHGIAREFISSIVHFTSLFTLLSAQRHQHTTMTQPNIITSSERLSIVEFDSENEAHCNFLVKLWNTPLFIKSCGKTSIDGPDKAKAFIKNRFLTEYKRNGYGNYLVALKSGDDSAEQLVGTVALTKGDSKDSYLAPDLGFATLPEFNGMGIATEAAKTLMGYASTQLEVHDVFGFCDPTNETSRKVLEKSGLEFRGIKKLAAFGGVMGAVYASPQMDHNLEVYGLKE